MIIYHKLFQLNFHTISSFHNCRLSTHYVQDMKYVYALELYRGDKVSLFGEIISNGQRQTDKQVITIQSVLGAISTECCGYTM